MKCGNCNIEFPNTRAMLSHMLVIHGSTFDLETHPQYKEHHEAIQAALTPELKAALKIMSGVP